MRVAASWPQRSRLENWNGVTTLRPSAPPELAKKVRLPSIVFITLAPDWGMRSSRTGFLSPAWFSEPEP